MENHFFTASVEETERIGEELAQKLVGDEIIAFKGGLGAGKTSFVRGLAKGLSFCGEVSSPTFALVHQYDGGRVPLYHFDMYRVNTWDDLYSTGFFDYLGTGILAIEWSENIENAIENEKVITVTIEKGSKEDERTIHIVYSEG